MKGAWAVMVAGIILVAANLVLPPQAAVACDVIAVLAMGSEATRRARVIRGRRRRRRSR